LEEGEEKKRTQKELVKKSPLGAKKRSLLNRRGI